MDARLVAGEPIPRRSMMARGTSIGYDVSLVRMGMNMVVVARNDERVVPIHLRTMVIPVMTMIIIIVVMLGAPLVRVRVNVVVVPRHDQRIVGVNLRVVMSVMSVMTMAAMTALVRMRVDVVVVAGYNQRVVRIHLGRMVIVMMIVVVVIAVVVMVVVVASFQRRWVGVHCTLSNLVTADESRHGHIPSSLAKCRPSHVGVL